MMQTLEVASVATRGKSNGVASGRDFAYAAEIGLVGVAPILLHRYDDAAVERRAKAAKNSVMKKADDVDSYVYRTADGAIGMPGRNLKACLRETARSLQDPRSPRKSAMDLIKAAVQVEPFIASMGRTTWDAVDVQRVVVQRSTISRRRPVLHEGWQVRFTVIVLAPEYITADWLHDLITRAGRFTGLGDFRPDYGRFRMDSFHLKEVI